MLPEIRSLNSHEIRKLNFSKMPFLLQTVAISIIWIDYKCNCKNAYLSLWLQHLVNAEICIYLTQEKKVMLLALKPKYDWRFVVFIQSGILWYGYWCKKIRKITNTEPIRIFGHEELKLQWELGKRRSVVEWCLITELVKTSIKPKTTSLESLALMWECDLR